MEKTIVTLLGVIAVLLGLNLVAPSSPTADAQPQVVIAPHVAGMGVTGVVGRYVWRSWSDGIVEYRRMVDCSGGLHWRYLTPDWQAVAESVNDCP